MTPLEAIIRSEIESSGAISFARFMELALYHPQYGYYTGEKRSERIGRSGDFFTSVSVGPLFGELLGMVFAEMWDRMSRPQEFALVEVGAHRGQLSGDIVKWSERCRPEFHKALRSAAIDYPGDLLQEITGCVFSNELLDSLPVHRITRDQGEWKELFVIWQRDGFAWQTNLPSSTALAERIQRLPLPSIDGYATEVHLEALRWVNKVARSLQRGFVLTIDYGLAEEDYYAPHRTDGTVIGYSRHRTSADMLARVGEQDITAHVNFSAIAEEGARNGLQLHGFTDQSRFVAGIIEANQTEFSTPSDPGRLAQLKTLLHPEMMGRTFKVLIQQRGMDGATLSGLKFGRNYIF